MYIPELKEATRQFYEDCTGAPVRDSASLPSALNDWVKIPLDGPMTVYAYVWDREEEEVVA
jgi:hypothetical protein